jgi:hypothetical protein
MNNYKMFLGLLGKLLLPQSLLSNGVGVTPVGTTGVNRMQRRRMARGG